MLRPEHSKLAGAAIGLGVLGAAAIGGYMATRPQRGNRDDAPGRTARGGSGDYTTTGQTVTIARPRTELFAFWKDFQNLPGFMENVIAIQPTGSQNQAVWTVRGPAGTEIEFETQIVREVENELIAWRSVEGSSIETEGRIEFSDAPGDRGTRVTAIIAYKPPAGMFGRAIATLLRREPEIQARHDLKRFKMLMEAGEIATSARTKGETRKAQLEET